MPGKRQCPGQRRRHCRAAIRAPMRNTTRKTSASAAAASMTPRNTPDRVSVRQPPPAPRSGLHSSATASPSATRTASSTIASSTSNHLGFGARAPGAAVRPRSRPQVNGRDHHEYCGGHREDDERDDGERGHARTSTRARFSSGCRRDVAAAKRGITSSAKRRRLVFTCSKESDGMLRTRAQWRAGCLADVVVERGVEAHGADSIRAAALATSATGPGRRGAV